jgi:2'-5' RNA ligase
MNKPVYARILYDEVKNANPEGGLYVWCTPDSRSTLKLQKLMAGAPFKTRNTTQLHCTIMYHHDVLPESVDVPEDREMTGLLRELVIWDEPNGESILVGVLHSEDLQELHQELEGQGLKHSFEDYTAHISLGKDLQKDEQTLAWIQEKNELLDGLPIVIDFDACLKGSSIV